MTSIDQWAIPITGDNPETVAVDPRTGEPVHRTSPRKSAANMQPATVTPPTDNTPTSLIDQQAHAAIAAGHLDPTTRYTTDAFIEGYRAGYQTAWQHSGATYHLADDGTYHHTGGAA